MPFKNLNELVFWHVLWKNWEIIRKKKSINIKDFITLLNLGYKPDDILGDTVIKINPEDYNEVMDLLNEGIEIVPFTSSEYPTELKKYPADNKIYPPLVVYYLGNIKKINFDRCVAIVGTRNCSLSGRIKARNLANKLAKMNITVVTGFARGIDTEATCGALETGGSVIAVLPWLKPIYPPENSRLANDVTKNGILLSENIFKYSGRIAKRQIFLRNRIISGLSKVVIVIETGKKGGSFHQVDYALKRGKKVFILKPDGKDKELLLGFERFKREGAEPVNDIDDLLYWIYEFINKYGVKIDTFLRPL